MALKSYNKHESLLQEKIANYTLQFGTRAGTSLSSNKYKKPEINVKRIIDLLEKFSEDPEHYGPDIRLLRRQLKTGQIN